MSQRSSCVPCNCTFFCWFQLPFQKTGLTLLCYILNSATSGLQGPVYLCARRETLEEELDVSVAEAKLDLTKWPSIEPAALSPKGNQTCVLLHTTLTEIVQLLKPSLEHSHLPDFLSS